MFFKYRVIVAFNEAIVIFSDFLPVFINISNVVHLCYKIYTEYCNKKFYIHLGNNVI